MPSQKIILMVFVSLVLIVLNQQQAKAMKPGVYNYGRDEEQLTEYRKLRQLADRVIFCPHPDRVDLGIVDKRGRTIHFSLKQIKRFLSQEKHKDLIVVEFHPPYTEHGQIYQKELLNLGYKRVVTSCGHGLGWIVLTDSDSLN